MPRRTVYRDPSSGRFISESAANALEAAVRIVYDEGTVAQEQVLSFGMVEEEVEGDIFNWNAVDHQYSQSWTADDEPLDLYGLSQTEFPEGFDSFKVVYFVPNNPDYPREHASSSELLPDQWPPSLDLLRGHQPTGIARIYFRRS